MSLASGIGLISGLNFEDIIQKLSAVNSRPIRLLQNRQKLMETRKDAIQSINKVLLSLHGALEKLNETSDFIQRIVSVGDGDIASATATADAAEGTFSFKVLQLAQEHRLAAQGVDDPDATPIASADGFFSFSVGGGTVKTINVTATSTLNQLRDAINADSSSGLHASIINDGSATNSHRLVLTSTKSGLSNQVQILTNDTTLNFATKSIEAAAADSSNDFDGAVTSSGTYTGTGTKNFVVKVTTGGAIGVAKFQVSTDGGLTFGSVDEFTTSGTPTVIGDGVQIDFTAGTADFAAGDTFTIDAFDPLLQSPQDAVVEIDGIQIRRDSNDISDAIGGLTITAKKVDADATTITVKNDSFNASASVHTFVSSYNALLDEIERLASFDSETETRGVLFADATVRSIQSTLTNIVSSAVVGLIDNNSLGAIGVDVDKKGRLSVDSDKLSEAFKDNFEVVRNIFALVGLSTSTGITFDKSTEATFAGTYEVSVTTAAERASVSSAQVIDAAGIALDELLTFTMEDKTEAFSIAAGTKAADAATALNTFFDDKGLNLTAVEDGGKLRIDSNGYGSAEQFSILSDQSGAVSSQLGFGTTTQDLIGVDVAGTIDGLVATGSGRFLSGADGSRVEGLKLLISSGGPVSGTVTFTKGIAHQMFTKIDAITDESDGIIKTKTESLKQRIEMVGDQIQRLRDRLALQEEALRRQFVGLEVKLSSLKSGGDFLLSQLASINSLRFFG